MFEECSKFMNAKTSYLNKGPEDISEKLIKQLKDYDDPDKENKILKEDVAQVISRYAIMMLMLHEYSHIVNGDNENDTLSNHKKNEKRADNDAFNELIKIEPNLLSYLGALYLQSSGLLLNSTIESDNHPDADERIEYIFSSFPKEGEDGVLFRDILELFVYLWSVLNNREDAFREIGQECTSDRLFAFLKKEKITQSEKRDEEGRAENAKRMQEYNNRKGMKFPD